MVCAALLKLGCAPAGIKSDIPGTSEHEFKEDEKKVQKDERAAGDEGAKMNMSEGDKLKSDIPGTKEHKETHQ